MALVCLPRSDILTLFGWLQLVAGADLLWEKSTVGWLVLVAVADLVWEKNTTDWFEQNKITFTYLFIPYHLGKDIINVDVKLETDKLSTGRTRPQTWNEMLWNSAWSNITSETGKLIHETDTARCISSRSSSSQLTNISQDSWILYY